MTEDPNTLHVLNQQRNWDTLYFYQKSDVVYQLASLSATASFIYTKTERATR